MSCTEGNGYYLGTLEHSPFTYSTKEIPDFISTRIQEDLKQIKPYRVSDLENFFEKNHNKRSMAWFRIRDSKLYVRKNNGCPDFGEIFCAIYKIISHPEVDLKNGDYIMLLGDGGGGTVFDVPILCHSKDISGNGVVIPMRLDYQPEYTNLINAMDKAFIDHAWKDKRNLGFFIGYPSEGGYSSSSWKQMPRARLVMFSLDNPDLAYARFNEYTHHNFICEEMKALSALFESKNHISPYDACAYKYIFDVHGCNASSYRNHWILRSGSVLIRSEEGPPTWFTGGLIPFQTFVPYKEDLSDLAEKIKWLQTHDLEAQQIALNAREFSKKFINSEYSHLYLLTVMQELNKMIINE